MEAGEGADAVLGGQSSPEARARRCDSVNACAEINGNKSKTKPLFLGQPGADAAAWSDPCALPGALGISGGICPKSPVCGGRSHILIADFPQVELGYAPRQHNFLFNRGPSGTWHALPRASWL
jgi:hypothetical protein